MIRIAKEIKMQGIKKGNSLALEIPLEQFNPCDLARYIICLYDFEFISENTKCFISVEINASLIFKVTPDCYDESLVRKFYSRMRMIPCSYFKDDLEDAGFDILETSETSWEISKK